MWPFSREARERRRQDKEEESEEKWREREEQEALLIKAAAVGQVYLVCLRDTWDFIVRECDHGSHSKDFVPPDEDDIARDRYGRLVVPVSGRTLSAILAKMAFTAFAGVEPTPTKAVAAHIRDTITEALQPEDTDLPYIVLDAAAETAEPDDIDD